MTEKKVLVIVLFIIVWRIYDIKKLVPKVKKQIVDITDFILKNWRRNKFIIAGTFFLLLFALIVRKPGVFGYKKFAVLLAGVMFALLTNDSNLNSLITSAYKIFTVEFFALVAFSFVKRPPTPEWKRCALIVCASYNRKETTGYACGAVEGSTVYSVAGKDLQE